MSEPIWLEEPTRFSRSVLWDLQRRFYETKGEDAWIEDIVPTYVSTNNHMAEAYAATITEWAESLGLDNDDPVYILEIGAGSGRLGARVAQALRRRRVEGTPRIVYLLTDLSERNIAFWNRHPIMSELVQEGLVDFARLDLEEESPVTLQHGGITLGEDTRSNPIGIVGNYIVGTVRQDAFHARGGDLFEVIVRACCPDLNAVDAVDAVSRVELTFNEVPVCGDYYGDPALDGLLRAYTNGLTDANVLVPVGLLRNLMRLFQIGGGRSLVILGDKALRHLHEWQGKRQPHLAIHGSISVWANFHAVGYLVEHLGGRVWHSRSSATNFTISTFLLGADERLSTRVERAFRDWLDDFGPADYHRLYKLLREVDLEDLTWLLLVVRLSRFDPSTLLRLAPAFRKALPHASGRLQRDTAFMLEEVWQRRYRVSPKERLPFQIARLYTRIGRYEDGLNYYRVSLEEEGPDRSLLHNMGLCLERLSRLIEAEEVLRKALERYPDYEPARKRLIRIRRKLGNGDVTRPGTAPRGKETPD